jgi:hypothetical protein
MPPLPKVTEDLIRERECGKKAKRRVFCVELGVFDDVDKEIQMLDLKKKRLSAFCLCVGEILSSEIVDV